ncbi:MAG: hypothetical protein JWP35_1588 [Caulobacter sp.]|nr:hypothetical protein [Caulobacter sp.]
MALDTDNLAAVAARLPPVDSAARGPRRHGRSALMAIIIALPVALPLCLALSGCGPSSHSPQQVQSGGPSADSGGANEQESAADPSQLTVGAEVEFQTGPDMPTHHRGTIITPPKETSPGYTQAQIMAAPSADFPQDNGEIWERVDLIRLVNAAHVDTKPAEWFMGRWNLAVAGATVDNARPDGYVYRQEEGGAGLGQALQVNSDGTYVWQIQPGGAPVSGSWRAADANEPGARIVLLAGEGGSDWTVYVNSVHAPGDHIKLVDASASVRYGARAN